MNAREKPIIFSGPMVRAILDGRKTMTRRIMKPQPIPVNEPSGNPDTIYTSGFFSNLPTPKYILDQCPYGQPGDHLWVRETWRIGAWSDDGFAVDYKADGFCRREWLDCPDDELYTKLWIESTDDARKVFGGQENYHWKVGESPCRWRPSIFMPRWASRITLEVLSVKVERLQEISEEDAIKEGFEIGHGLDDSSPFFAAGAFKKYWDSLNGKKHSWSSSPWVWVIEFKQLKEAQCQR